ncbi:tetratricopeptide repeat protein [Micromonospora sp. LOL_015]|uniref:tetratricopeptide repeat protein n=1 Tax=Micromonospora sp. LOL_015 TaxID=3345416 RepID=UPI003A869AB8
MSLGLGEITTQAHGLISVGDLLGARDLLATALADTDPRPAHAGTEQAEAAGLLARVTVALGDAPAARAWAAYAYSANQRLHGTADERTIGAAATLAAVLHRVGSDARAAHLYREVIDELCAIDGPESLRVLAAHADLATVEFARGECDVARDRLEDAWELHREVYGEGHPAGIKMLARLGAMQRDCGRLAESDVSLSLAIDLCRTRLPADHPLVGQVAALAEASADPAHRCGGPGPVNDGPDDTGGPDPGRSPDDTDGPGPNLQPDDSGGPGPSLQPDDNGGPGHDGGLDQGGWPPGTRPAGGPTTPAADPAGRDRLTGPAWAEPGWIEPEPPVAEVADPRWSAAFWTEPNAPSATPTTGRSSDDATDGHRDGRHRADPPWLDPLDQPVDQSVPDPVAELDSGRPWAQHGWIEREPASSDADDPLWSPSGWLTDDPSPARRNTTGQEQGGDQHQPDEPDPTDGRPATIPPPRVPVDLPPSGSANHDGSSGIWLFDEPWWPPEQSGAGDGSNPAAVDRQDGPDQPDAPERPDASDAAGPVSPFGPVRFRQATGPSAADSPTADSSISGPAAVPGEPVPPETPAFVPNPRVPDRADARPEPAPPVSDEDFAGREASVDADSAVRHAEVTDGPGTGATDEPAASVAAGGVGATIGTGATGTGRSTGTLSRLPRRELSRIPDRRRSLPVRRQRGELVPVPKPAATAARPRGPMLVFTGVVVVLLGAAAVVAGVSLVDETPSEPAGAPAEATPPTGTPTSAAPPATPGTAPGGVGLRDNRDSVTLTWTYPAGAEGQVLISGGSSDQQPRAFMTLPAGADSFVAYGLDESIDYCFTVAVVYSADVIGQADPVCTDRSANAR